MSETVFAYDARDIAACAGARALVTGGAGFIGSRLCYLLRTSGWEVHSASRRESIAAPPYRHWQLDLTDSRATQDLVKAIRPDYVFHLASHVWGAPDLAHVLPTFHNNLHTTVNLLHAIAGGDCRRFIVTGSTNRHRRSFPAVSRRSSRSGTLE